MRTCKYGRNSSSNRCNKPCRKGKHNVGRNPNGTCSRRARKRCKSGKEWVQFLTHGECLPECEFRNPTTKMCGRHDD